MNHTPISEVQGWLGQLSELVTHKTCRAPEFFRPFHFVSLALVLKARRAQDIQLPDTLHDYAARMHLWEAIGLRPPRRRGQERDAVGRFLPIEPLRSRAHVEDCSDRIADIAQRARATEESRRSLSIAVSELMDNCFSHAGAGNDGLHGLACAQFWPRGNLMQIAIADMGIGVRATFEQADRDEFRSRVQGANCCTLATELGASSKLDNGHAGYGLALARQLAEQNKGTITVYSGHEWFHSTRGTCTEGAHAVPWNGTMIVAEFDTTTPLSTQAVYQTWPTVRGYDDEDFDF